MHETWFGPKVLVIDLVMHSKDVFWKVYGSNLMVKVEGEYGEGLWCLGFVDGGDEVRTSVVIGGVAMRSLFEMSSDDDGRDDDGQDDDGQDDDGQDHDGHDHGGKQGCELSPRILLTHANAPEQSSAPKKASVMRRMG
ncbi:basic 7S globulin [Artemisia annua]|uniref:Basic 7S globulin n=1 Tax=Artemisia annua TaxID=35608 RepID=A0A2U1N7F1_ARTAN|nr:basic 7S globulin [Artemisia annua]